MISNTDCREGGQCVAQTELEEHARDFNHLCDRKHEEGGWWL
jgi:hypothetical protein